MSPTPDALLATLGQPLFGNMGLALATVLGAVTAFTLGVAAFGRWLAATHPVSEAVATAAAAVPAAATVEISDPEVLAVIAAAVYATAGANGRLVSVKPVQVSVEALMQQWSLEGRRQIYSSHKVR